MKVYLSSVLVFFSFYAAFSQANLEFSGNVEANVFLFSEELPFWMYTNTNGFLNEQSNVGVSAFAKANYILNPNNSLELGLGGYLRDGFVSRFDRSDLYLSYENKWITVIAGAKRREMIRSGLSTINDDILFTGNIRPLPGVLFQNTAPIHITQNLFLNVDLGHYRLNDDRSTRETNVHYKKIEVGFRFNNGNKLTTALRHYVQWGGVTEEGIALPNGLDAFARVFIGNNASNIDNPNETINALGNHLGSYQINYKLKRENLELDIYHHSLFDDRSGRELNNFPDGVWGIYFQPQKSQFFKGLLYEYVQTISQSGSRDPTPGGGQQSGGDNYFVNGVYPSGWTYEGRTIGLPFINPIDSPERPQNNRSIAHHLGVFSELGVFSFKMKLTYLQNLGTYSRPFEARQKQVLSLLEVAYATEQLGVFNLQLSADGLNDGENRYALGFGYRYFLN